MIMTYEHISYSWLKLVETTKTAATCQYIWKMNQSCDFVADKNTQTMLPHVLLYLGNTKAHAVNPKYQLWLVQQKLFCLIYVWEIHSNNSWKIALAQSLQASNQHVYQRQATRISLIYIWLGVALRVGDVGRVITSHPEGSCGAFKLHPLSVRAANNRRTSKSKLPIVIMETRGSPNTNIPSISFNLYSS